jgi:septal ring factor EnvC (AmiA/AmiB activator)
MQLETNIREGMVRGVTATNTERDDVMPIGESITLASVLKWMVGLVLAPWLWHERKRLDKLKEDVEKFHYTKDEIKEQIEDKTSNLREDISEVKETMKIMNDNIVVMGVTIARIDERSKRRNERDH